MVSYLPHQRRRARLPCASGWLVALVVVAVYLLVGTLDYQAAEVDAQILRELEALPVPLAARACPDQWVLQCDGADRCAPVTCVVFSSVGSRVRP